MGGVSGGAKMNRKIVIDETGKIELDGSWKVGELLQCAQFLANWANGFEVNKKEENPTEK